MAFFFFPKKKEEEIPFGNRVALPPDGRCSESQLCSCPLQVGGGLSVLPLAGLGHGHVDALQPLLGVLLVLRLQHVRLAVSEDLEGAWQPPLPPLPGHHLGSVEQRGKLDDSRLD